MIVIDPLLHGSELLGNMVFINTKDIYIGIIFEKYLDMIFIIIKNFR